MTRGWQWAALIGASAILGGGLLTLQAPAALLLGPMLCAVAAGIGGAAIRVPRWAFLGAQIVIGCLCARSVTAGILVTIAANWSPILAVVAGTLVSAFLVGLTLSRFGRLPGTTAAWGSSPGGASAMVAMAAEFGADPRLVAFMQYLRVILVTLSASMVSRLLIGARAGEGAPVALDFSSLPPLGPFALTLGVGALGYGLARAARLPAGAMLGPLLVGAVAHGAGWVEITLPDPLLAVTYATVGWYVGLSFTLTTVRHAFFALPKLLVATGALILLCGGSAWALTRLEGVDPLTAYLATSPGGLDSMAIIAVGSHADIGFVMAMQTLRLVLVILTGPTLAKLIVKLS